MIVEVRPGPMTNKGGELILRTVIDRLGARWDLAVEHWIGPYSARSRLGLLQKLWWKRLGPLAGLPGQVVPSAIRRSYGLVSESDIDAVLDASGYGYGDKFGPERTERAAANARRWRRKGIPYILLPQAFGPFTSPRIQRAARSLISQADLVYARDNVSLEAIDSLGVAGVEARLAPDITVSMAGEPPTPSGKAATPLGFIVPNEKMLQLAGRNASEAYVAFLASAAVELRARGVNPVLLVHETSGGDRQLAEAVAGMVPGGVPAHEEEDPVRLKGLIGTGVILVGSRFHALLAALSQGVPVIAMGWSHKYPALLEDYGCSEFCLELPADPETISRRLDAALGGGRDALVSGLIGYATIQQQRLEAVWHEVVTCVEEGRPARRAAR